jgi:hypothetical protein
MSNNKRNNAKIALELQGDNAKIAPKTGFPLLIETLKEQHNLDCKYFESIFHSATDGVLSGKVKPTIGMLKRFSDEFGLDFQQIKSDYKARLN